MVTRRGCAGRRSPPIVADELNVTVGPAAGRCRLPSPAELRHRAEARGQRPGRRPAPGQERAAGHQGLQVRRLVRRRTPAWSLAGGLELEPQEYTLETVVADSRRRRRSRRSCAARAAASWCSNTEVTPELAAEGLARDMVRAIQQARRDADLQVTDRIELRRDRDAGGPRRGPGARGAHRRRDPRNVVHGGGGGARGRHRGPRGRRREGRDQPAAGLTRAGRSTGRVGRTGVGGGLVDCDRACPRPVRRRRHPDPPAGRHRVGQPRRAGDRRRRRGRAACAPAPRGRTTRAHRRRADGPGPGEPSGRRRPPGHRARQRQHAQPPRRGGRHPARARHAAT